MAAKSLTRKPPTKQLPTLREQIYEQELKLLELADKSTNPEIQACALRLAREDRIELRKQEARLSPRGALLFSLALCLVAVGACWYSFLHYPITISWEINGSIIAGWVVATIICLTLSRHVPASEATGILRTILNNATSKKNRPSDDGDQPLLPD